MSASNTLFIYRAESATLADILSAFTDVAYTALLEGVEQYLVGRHIPGEAGLASTIEVAAQALQADADPVRRIRSLDPEKDFKDLIRARLFNDDFDLIWERHGAATLAGVAWLRGEQRAPDVLRAPNGWECFKHSEVFQVKNQYLIWGRVVSFEDGWARLYEQRVGNITVPISTAPGKIIGHSVKMRAMEYFGPAPGKAGKEHGNCRLLAECFRGFEVEADSNKGQAWHDR